MKTSIFGILLALPISAVAQHDEDLAKKLANPIAELISVPLQYNYDHHYGDNEAGHKSYLNVQPVVPFSLNAQWNLISRTIVPLIHQHDVIRGNSESGMGDITQSLFFAPKAPAAGGPMWAAGPVFLLPTGTDHNLSARKWGAGPTAVIVKQDGPWTYGALVNHIWGVGGVESRTNVSNTFLQPFLSFTTKDAWTFGINTESTYDWKAEQWTVPINLTASKLMKFGKQPVSIGGGIRYWADSPNAGPHDFGLRLVMTFLFPK